MGSDYFSDKKRVDTEFKSDCKINTLLKTLNNKKCIQNVRKLFMTTLIDSHRDHTAILTDQKGDCLASIQFVLST